MAKDVKFLISASAAKAEDEIRKLQRTGQQTASILEREFEQLGIKSSIAFDNKRKAAQSAYDRIKASGLATHDELVRAEKAMGDKMVSLDEEQFGARTGLLQKFKANWLATTAAIAGAWVAVTQAWNLANDAAKGLQEKQSFANLAASHGAASDQIIADLKRVSAETVSTRELMEKAGTAMLLGIPAEKLSKLMEIARASSRVTGESITKSFSDISLAVARGSKMILDNLGIIVDVEKANKDYAATLGKTAEQLTDTERKTAFMNATLKAGEEIIKRVGVQAETQAEKLQKFTARMEDLKETAGKGLLAVLNVVSGAFYGAAAAALMFVGAIYRLHQGIAWLTGRDNYFAEMKTNADAAFAAANDLASKGFGDLATAVDIVSGKLDPLNKGIVTQAENMQEAEEKAKKLAEAKQAEAAAWENLSEYADTATQKMLEADEKLLEEMRKRSDKYEQMVSDSLEYEGQYVEAIRKRQELEKRSPEYIQLQTDAINGLRGAVDALANAEQRRAVELAEAQSKQNEELRGYADQTDGMKDKLDALNGADREMLDLHSEIREGLRNEAELRDRLAVAWAKQNQQAVAAYSTELQYQEILNKRLNNELELLERKKVLTGEIVGFNNGEAIYRDEYQKKQAATGYVSDAQLLGAGGSFDSGVVFVDANGNPIEPRATGGPVKAGMPYIVGEKRAEVFVPDRNGTIVPDASSVGGVSISIDKLSITVQGGETGQSTAREIARQLYPELKKIAASQRAA